MKFVLFLFLLLLTFSHADTTTDLQIKNAINKTLSTKEAERLFDLYTNGIKEKVPTLNLKTDFGAKGDGKTNDTAAFSAAAERINKLGKGKLFIPKGTYIVGRQFHIDNQFPYYQNDTIFEVDYVNNLIIEGEKGTVIKMADNMRFGSFDKYTGDKYDPFIFSFVKKEFWNKEYRATPGHIFNIQNSENIIIRNLEINGNLEKYIIGGQFGDTGYQADGTGLRLRGNKYIVVDNIYTHHNPLDGFYIAAPKATFYDDQSENDPHLVTKLISEYNGRQGFSWTGGKGIIMLNSKLNHTGKSKISSKPGNGIDIEPQSSTCFNGYFENIEVTNNTGAGIGHGGNLLRRNIEFKNAYIRGTTNYPIYLSGEKIQFTNCKIYGSIGKPRLFSSNPSSTTIFSNCIFENK